MTCYHSPTWRVAAIAAGVATIAQLASAGSIAAVDCFTRAEDGLCAGISFSQADALFGAPSSVDTASDAHRHTTTIDRDAAVTAGFTPPEFGLDPTAPFFASAEQSPKSSTPAETYRVELRGGSTIDARLPAGRTSEFQRTDWGSTFRTTLVFDGPGPTVDVEFAYNADAQFSAPTGAKDRPESGIMTLVGGLLLRESEPAAAAPAIEYYGEFIFLPSHPTLPATASNQWAPEEGVEVEQQDTIDVDTDREAAALSVVDTETLTVATGTTYVLEGFFSGTVGGEIFADPAAAGVLAWATLGDASASVDLRLLTPGATLVAAVPIPETTAAATLLAGLAIATCRRQCGVSRLGL